uniref:Major capsid protein n=1 Tax=Stone flounder iridovirus 724/China TaxID=996368 RepID=F2WWK2_9VIRU|nr:major capsid protein [Stone flounder iridovirus 724/China]
MSAISGANVTSGFIDISAFDAMETHLYGGDNAVTYFARETVRSSWYSKLPVTLSKQTGHANFGQEFSVTVARGGDYLINVWLRVKIPSITSSKENSYIRWCDNLMHNLVEEVSVSFNDLVAQTLTSEFLDFWNACMMPGSKQSGYNKMIGMRSDLVGGITNGQTMPAAYLNLPTPLFFTRDTGLALPTVSLPYNEVRIHFKLRRWEDLLISQSTQADMAISTVTLANIGNVAPALTNVSVMGTYAVLTSEEREVVAQSSRSMLIEQCQVAPRVPVTPVDNSLVHLDLRFSHPVKALFFAVKNVTHRNVQSNYTAASPVYVNNKVNLPLLATNPLSEVSLIYENTPRLHQMGVDYFTSVDPYYFAPSMPEMDGVMTYCYTLDMGNINPMGSTNYGRLSNVTLSCKVSDNAKTTAAGGGGNGTGYTVAQKFELVVIAVNHNIMKIADGAAGFPIL